MYLERPTRRRRTSVRWTHIIADNVETMNTNVGFLRVRRNRADIELVRQDDASKESFVLTIRRSELRELLELMEEQS